MTERLNRPRRLVVFGAGTMGCDIAVVFLAGGWQVDLISPSAGTRAAVPARIKRALERISAPAVAAECASVHGTLDSINWKGVDLVIEAVTEDLALKRQLMQEIESQVSADTPLASNTSTFSIGRISDGMRHPQRVLGMHFFMPAHLVPLVEVISGEHTDASLAESMVSLLKQLGKMPIWVKKDVPGFVGNRLQHAMLREALFLMEDGVATAEEIDIAVRFGFGFRFLACGPILQKEMSGWDTNQRAGAALYPHLHQETHYPAGMERMVNKGHTGMKALHGVWQWTEESAAETKAQIELRLSAAMTLLNR